MSHRTRSLHPLSTFVFVILYSLLASFLPAAGVQAAPPQEAAAPTVTTVELIAVEDQGMIESAPTFVGGSAPYFVLNGRPDTHSEDWNFIQFDLSQIPADAIIQGAQLKLGVIGFGGPARDLEVGRAEGDWEEGVTSWSTMPTVTWGGPVQTITDTGEVSWPLLPLVEAWHNGTITNNGVVVRTLDNGNNAGSQARTKDGVCLDQDADDLCDYPFDLPPRLVITYSEPAFEGPRPDLGDAPDSTNHHGVNNTAYPAGGVLGQFPTVWDVPAGQPAGPRHDNVTGEGILGNFLSREAEADLGPDQDGPNNILRNAAGMIGDVADNDRGDDGWRNRNIRFFDCQRQNLVVRVSRAQAATLGQMYLNVWFDGNRDGDWDDNAPCTPPSGGGVIPSTEWIVQDFVVNMAAIAPGGFVDINVNTETVLNTAEGNPHWMRFMLSERRAVQTPGGRADGRGPHPTSALGSYKFGETEDVFQKTPLVGEPGELVLEKRVNTATSPVRFGDMVTYEISLRHEGGSQPVQAQIRDELPYPLHIHPRIVNGAPQWVTVESPTGGAGPLLAALDLNANLLPPTQVIKWQGALAPGSAIKLTFDVHVLSLCGPNEQTKPITNLAQARTKEGNSITDEVTFNVACPGYDGIIVTQHVLTGTFDSLLDVHDLPLQAEVSNGTPHTVTLGLLHNQATNVPGDQTGNPRFLGRVTLAPGESQLVDYTLRMESEFSDELTLPADFAVASNLAYCILPGGDGFDNDTCPDRQQYPQLWDNAQPITFTVRPHDLGDAPDSTNHAGMAMTAYAGGAAGTYPTVFDPALGQPQGPLHRRPRPFHLGERVSREAEADIGPDQDPQNNLEPAADVANLDRFDDGSRLTGLADCQPATVEVLVAITPQAFNWFVAQNQPGYLNAWVDSNRDGDWDDWFNCQGAGGQVTDVVEHILIDQPIDVIALGPGLHPLSFTTNRVRWPAQLANDPTWVRFTLSEAPSNKTFVYGAINYSEGRGPAAGYLTGETEDHRLYPQGGAHDGPDLAVQLNGQIKRDSAGAQFKIEVGNKGVQPASGATLTFQKPAELRDSEIVLLQAPGIPSANIKDNGDSIQFLLPFIEQNNIIAILIGLAIPPNDGSSKEYAAAATVNLAGDIDPSNNQDDLILRGLQSSPLIGVFMDYTDDALTDYLATGRAATCQSNPILMGQAVPNSMVEIVIDGAIIGTTQADANGNFSYNATLADGLYRIQARYPGQSSLMESEGINYYLRLKVDSSLPIDPLSLTLTDSSGRVYHPQMLGAALQGTQIGALNLRSGETYEIGINRCGSDPNVVLQIELENTLISNYLRDDDGDGRHTGSFTYDAGVGAAAAGAATQLRFIVTTSGAEQSFTAALQPLTTGIVRDVQTGQPLAGATVNALAPANVAQLEAQTTGADGSYSFLVADGIYQLEVAASGYQTYRTGEITVDNGLLAQDLALTPALNEAADHTIYMTANGFSPAFLKVKPGDVIEWVNADLTEHATVRSGGWASGALAAGERFQIKLDAEGTYLYTDGAAGLNTGTIRVAAASFEEPVAENVVFLPLVDR